MRDRELYELLAITDALREGRARERRIAHDRLKEHSDESVWSKGDFVASHDIEDLIAVVDGRAELEQIASY